MDKPFFQKKVLNSNEELNYLDKANNISKKNVINKRLRKLESSSFCIDIFINYDAP